MKRAKQWNTTSKWRRICHQAGQLILYTLKPCEVTVSNTIQKWITIIETTGHESSRKQFCTIQIKVTTNTPQIPHRVKAWVTHYRNMWAEGEIFIKYYTEITSRFSRVTFATEKLNWKHRKVFALLLFVPNKEEFSFIWVQFQFIRWHPCVETWCKTFSAAVEFPALRWMTKHIHCGLNMGWVYGQHMGPSIQHSSFRIPALQ